MTEGKGGSKVTSVCSNCGTPRDPSERCPRCGNTPDVLASEIARVNKAIADMNQEDIRLKGELKRNSQNMQAALHQKSLLTNVEAERQRKGAPKQRPWSRGKNGQAANGAAAEGVKLPPRQRRQQQQTKPAAAPPPRFEEPHLEPETSPRSVQNVLLALAPLLIGVTAVIFALVDSRFSTSTRLIVLGIVTALLLLAAPAMVARGLVSTAESLASVGLGLLPVVGFVFSQLFTQASPKLVFGIIFAVTTAIAFLFHQATALTSARYMVVLASQPVLPLLAWDYVQSPAGWAVVLALVAAQNAVMARALEHFHRPTPTPAKTTTYYLWEITWILHGLAIGAAAVYALSALLSSQSLAAGFIAALILILVAAVGMLGALMLRRRPLNDLAAGAVTLAVIGSAARVAFIAIPQDVILVMAIVLFATSLTVRALPAGARRGPQLATALALGILTLFVLGVAVKAAMAPLLQSLPMWAADLSDYQARIAERAGSPGTELVFTIAMLTASAGLALPPGLRREGAVAGAALTGLCVTASLGLGFVPGMWFVVLTALAILAWGIVFEPDTSRGITAHLVATIVVAGAALTVALARQSTTAGVLTVFAVAGLALGAWRPQARLADTAKGMAAFAVPGAVATGLLTIAPGVSATAALTAGFIAASATLAVVTVRLIAQRKIGTPLALGSGLGALLITGAAFAADEAKIIDAGVGALLMVAAILLALAPSIDASGRTDRWLDGADMAAAAVTVAVIASLARTAEWINPAQWLFQSAAAVLLVALAIRALPEDWRRGPGVGVGFGAAVVGAIAGYYALAGGLTALAVPGELWTDRVPEVTTVASAFGWQVPASLVVLALASAIALPRPRNYDLAAVFIVLATLGAPAAMGWPWWAPIVMGLTIATCYSVAATVAVDPRAGYARLAVAITVGLHALLASLVMLWTTAAALGMIALLAAVTAGLSAAITRLSAMDGSAPPPHLEVVGGTGVVGALVTAPAAVAAYTADTGASADIVLTITVLSIFGALGLLFVWRRYLAGYLGWGTVGVAISSTSIAIAALIIGRPAGVYAAAAALLVVLAELLRASVHNTERAEMIREARRRAGPQRWRVGEELLAKSRWPTHPGSMAAAGAAIAAVIAFIAIVPALHGALVVPYDTLNRIWQGPPPPVDYGVDHSAVLTAAILTIAAAIAAVGFGGGLTRAVSVVVPGLAVTLMILPVSFNLQWPHTVLAGLGVFTLCMLSVALTVPPAVDDSTRGIRAARVAVLLIGLIAGGAGLAGALATPGLTIFTFAGAVGVGLAAALGGRIERARILGWLGGALAAQLLVLCVSLRLGTPPELAAFAVLAVGAALITSAGLLPRFTAQESQAEASAIEWAGYAAGAIAVMLALRSPFHVAAVLIGWGAILSLAAIRVGRPDAQQRLMFYAAGAGGLVALLLFRFNVDLTQNPVPEFFTLPFALLVLFLGLHQLQQRPELGSWAAYGPALIAALGPTVALLLVADPPAVRLIGLLIAGLAVLIWGSQKQQRAPVAIGATAMAVAAFVALQAVSTTWLAVGIAGVVLLIIGASSERRRRATDRYNQYR
jgi:hypothetical protein